MVMIMVSEWRAASGERRGESVRGVGVGAGQTTWCVVQTDVEEVDTKDLNSAIITTYEQ
jgi:hypothetical protein